MECSECKKDPELYGDGRFVIESGNLKNGVIPCGCGVCRYKPYQSLILAKRNVGNRFQYNESQILNDEKNIDCYCPIHDKHWTSNVSGLRSGSSGCKICGGKKAAKISRVKLITKNPTEKAIKRCGDDYHFLGFKDSFENRNSLIRIMCNSCNKEFTPKYRDFVTNGTNCPNCHRIDTNDYTDDIIDWCNRHNAQFINSDGIKVPVTKRAVTFKCSTCQDIHTDTVSNIIKYNRRKYACYQCNRNHRIEKDMHIKMQEMGITIDSISNDKKYRNNEVSFNCNCGNKFSTKVKRFMSNPKLCDTCSPVSNGFDPNKPASFYIFEWTHDDEKFIKYGITNRDVAKERLIEQNKSTRFKPSKIAQLNFLKGKDAANLERFVSDYRNQVVGCHGFIDKESFPDGYTETLPVSCIDDIKRIVLENTGINLE